MKKIIICCFALFTATTIKAQTVNVHFKNGQTIEYPSENVDYVDFSPKPADPIVTAGQVVDLGLSVYWASCNLGAEKPEESGNYYAWGEINPKGTYTESNYTYYDNNLGQYIEIGDDICGTQYDAATINLGSDWRMPTANEMQELIDKCSWEKVKINNVLGYKVTGTNGNTIFLPIAGFGGVYCQGYDYGNCICLSTSTKDHTGYIRGINTEFSGSIFLRGCSMYRGYSIRPVTSNSNAGGNPVDHSQDYLVTDKITASFVGGAYTSINGRIGSGSQLSWQFSNNSTESVTLTGLQLIDGASGNEGNNLLNEQVDVPANDSKTYTITIGILGVTNPRVRFTYLYNKKNYTVEASMQ